MFVCYVGDWYWTYFWYWLCKLQKYHVMCMSWSDIAGWFLFPQVPCALQYYDVVTKQFITYIQFDLSENCETKLELPEVKGHLIGDLAVAKIWRVLIKYNQIFCPGHEWVISLSHSLNLKTMKTNMKVWAFGEKVVLRCLWYFSKVNCIIFVLSDTIYVTRNTAIRLKDLGIFSCLFFFFLFNNKWNFS